MQINYFDKQMKKDLLYYLAKQDLMGMKYAQLKTTLNDYTHFSEKEKFEMMNFKDNKGYTAFQWAIYKNSFEVIDFFIVNFSNYIDLKAPYVQKGESISIWSLALSHNSHELINRLKIDFISIHEVDLKMTIFELIRAQETLSIPTFDFLCEKKVLKKESLDYILMMCLFYEKIDFFKHLVNKNAHLLGEPIKIKSNQGENEYNNFFSFLIYNHLNFKEHILFKALEFLIVNEFIHVKEVKASLFHSNKCLIKNSDFNFKLLDCIAMIEEKELLENITTITKGNKTIKV